VGGLGLCEKSPIPNVGWRGGRPLEATMRSEKWIRRGLNQTNLERGHGSLISDLIEVGLKAAGGGQKNEMKENGGNGGRGCP